MGKAKKRIRRKCKVCEIEKRLVKFYKDPRQKDGLSLTCRTCQKAANKAWNKVHPGYQREKRTGCTQEKYDELFREQKGCCAICDKPQHEQKKQMAADHCHVTGIIRGLLCINCNIGLGNFKHDLELFERATEYLIASKYLS